MTIYFVTRHPGALYWAKKHGIAFNQHCEHLDVADIKSGDKVIGSLPINLAAKVCVRGAEYWNLSIELPKEQRGKELSAEVLEQLSASIEEYKIEKM